MENGTEMASKIMKKSIQNSMSKNDQKKKTKHGQMKALNLGNHCFSNRKPYISQKSRFLKLVEKVVEKDIEN